MYSAALRPCFQRTGPIEGVGGDDIQEAVGFHLLQQVADTPAFQLEDALRLASLQQRERLLVVQRQLLRVDLLARRLFDQIDRLAEDCQVAQSQEVHFQQPGIFDVVH